MSGVCDESYGINGCKMCGAFPMEPDCFQPHHLKVFCETCNEKFESRLLLKKHEATSMHKLKKSLSCHGRKARWEKEEELEKRLRRNYPNLKRLTIRLERLPEETLISLILKKDKPPMFKCGSCAEQFIYKTSLTIHERTHKKEGTSEKLHGLLDSFAHDGDKTNICKICNKEFPSRTYLKIHKSIHY